MIRRFTSDRPAVPISSMKCSICRAASLFASSLRRQLAVMGCFPVLYTSATRSLIFSRLRHCEVVAVGRPAAASSATPTSGGYRERRGPARRCRSRQCSRARNTFSVNGRIALRHVWAGRPGRQPPEVYRGQGSRHSKRAGRFSCTLWPAPRETRHVPVLLDEVLDALNPKPGQTIVDCTIGLGGHAAEAALPHRARRPLIGLDMDGGNLELARGRLEPIGGTFELRHSNFAALPTILAELGSDRVHGILADLGVASPQIDDPARGFSYRQSGPLDMGRMDPTRGQPASALVNRLSEKELAGALAVIWAMKRMPRRSRISSCSAHRIRRS